MTVAQTRLCKGCFVELVQKQGEAPAKFARRGWCSRACFWSRAHPAATRNANRQAAAPAPVKRVVVPAASVEEFIRLNGVVRCPPGYAAPTAAALPDREVKKLLAAMPKGYDGQEPGLFRMYPVDETTPRARRG